jgi:hypothetical protein
VLAAARLHPPDRLPGAVDDAVQVDLQLAQREGVVLVLDAGQRHDAGVVDQHVYRPEPLGDLIEERAEPGPVGDVQA